jgi:adhesin transport system outer membrane protein
MYISAQMSPGAGFSSLSNIQSAEAKILQAQFDQQSKERELTDAGVRDYSSYKTAQERINSMDETIRSAQAVFDSYTRLFIAGKRQWLDLVNSSRELTLNKVSLADLKATYAVSAYQLALKRGQIPLSGANP